MIDPVVTVAVALTNYLIRVRVGTIPPTIADFHGNLAHMWMDRNSLTGTIPSALGSLTGLSEIRLNANSLHGMFACCFHCVVVSLCFLVCVLFCFVLS